VIVKERLCVCVGGTGKDKGEGDGGEYDFVHIILK
jgi:hypothetical protein